MKKVGLHRYLNLGVLMLLGSCLISWWGSNATNRRKVAKPTSPHSESLKIDSVEKQELEVSYNTNPTLDDYTNTEEKKMWMNYPISLFKAIRHIETGGESDPYNAIGDNGLSLGPYQISRAYWLDAVTHSPEIGGDYSDVKNPKYAERIMMAYWDRYAPDDNYETLARIHNGGPNGHRKSATDGYWNRINRRLLLETSGTTS